MQTPDLFAPAALTKSVASASQCPWEPQHASGSYETLHCGGAKQALAQTQQEEQPAGSACTGNVVVQALQDCLYGPELRGLPFVKLVYSQSYEQVSAPALLPTTCVPLSPLAFRQLGATDGIKWGCAPCNRRCRRRGRARDY